MIIVFLQLLEINQVTFYLRLPQKMIKLDVILKTRMDSAQNLLNFSI